MSDTLLVSTRKGLFTVARSPSGWKVAKADFLGDNVTLWSGARVDASGMGGGGEVLIGGALGGATQHATNASHRSRARLQRPGARHGDERDAAGRRRSLRRRSSGSRRCRRLAHSGLALRAAALADRLR